MKIAFGYSPNATDLKLALVAKAWQLGYEVEGLGAEDPTYANVAVAVAKTVTVGEFGRGVLVCGTSTGVSVAANRVKRAYYACVTDICRVQRATLSNNANLTAMGSQVMGMKSAEIFLEEYLKYTSNPASYNRVKVTRICEFEHEDQALLFIMDT